MVKGQDAEVLVVGAGIFGLIIAFVLSSAGRNVLLIDAAEPGAGASGGPVGALAPHPPDLWSEKKAFQRDALLAAPAFWAEVEQTSGIDPGYGRIGRIMPLRTEKARSLAMARSRAAAEHWREGDWRVLDAAEAQGWLAPEACLAGAVHETLSARIAPRRALAALAEAASRLGARSIGGTRVASVQPEGVTLSDGTLLRAGVVVVSAGVGSDSLVAPHVGKGVVFGVKGQALRLRGAFPERAPSVGDDGLYIVPHADGTVAIGSTSEAAWAHDGTDEALEAVHVRATRLCPWLAGAEVIERWAGVRPRGVGPQPVVGWVAPKILIASGGFKTGFALALPVAHLVDRLVGGEDAPLPAGVSPPPHP